MPVHTKLIAFSAVIALLGCTPETRTHKINVRGKLYDITETYYPSSLSAGSTSYTLFAEGRSFTCSGSEAFCVWALEKYLDQQRPGAPTDAPPSTSTPPKVTTKVTTPGPSGGTENGD